MTYTESTRADAGRQARLGPNHGYRISGDLACLNADLALGLGIDEQHALAQQWALQLWACDQPYEGGALRGTKIAEAAVDPHAQPQHLHAETFARLPAGDREYSMVLVLASRADGAREQVEDFANYPSREHFNVPALRGDVSYAHAAGFVTVRAERIENPRAASNLSGTLALELWALDLPYFGGQFSGVPLAGVELGRLEGQAWWSPVEHRLPVADVGAGKHLTLMLREWTATGYVTRDYRSFVAERVSEPVGDLVPEPVPVQEELAKVSAPAEAATSATSATKPAQPSVSAARPAARVQNQAQPPAAAAKTHVETESKGHAVPSEADLVSIEHGTLEQLAAVPGLNRKLAQEIIKARPFRTFEQLTRVRGVGEKTLRKLRAVLTL